MRDFELLSPVGDKETFYRAIKSGADAVYMGIPKFNARMRAENINLDNLEELVTYAHLKSVRVYITLNTLLTNSEVKEAVKLVGQMLKSGVDAFIVQDLGLIAMLIKYYPNIELHGSTQMGIHNINGALMAKKLGLKRIVLSREVGLEDIKLIKDNVDIDLEVFVQGALCVAFSGNCYLSSIKHSASGNRGECKQLCRLPYTLSNKANSVNGYMLSPSDICNLDYLDKLCELGVKSFKIEGRLRHSGYVAVATKVYREALDKIENGNTYNSDELKFELKKVFSRGDYISGYFEGNDIINYKTNNHLGEYIGKVVSVTRFKNLFKIKMQLNKGISSGDGLRFLSGSNQTTMGVGNIELDNNNYIVYGKNIVENSSSVYLTLDNAFENSVEDKSKKLKINFDIEILKGQKLKGKIYTDNNISFECFGDLCEQAQNKPTSCDIVINQLSKVDKDIFSIGSIDINIDDVYVPISKLNDLRRRLIEGLTNIVTNKQFRDSINVVTISDSDISLQKPMYKKLGIVDEYNSISNCTNYDALILSPTKYDLKLIENYYSKYIKAFNEPLILNLPIISLCDDIKVLDEIIQFCEKKNIILLGNNISSLNYVDRCKVYAGIGLNVTNDYTRNVLETLGVAAVVSSIEKWCPTLNNTYKVTKGNLTLMTMAHCPNKTLGYSCNTCGNCDQLNLCSDHSKYTIRRYKLGKCYFELVDNVNIDYSYQNAIEDIRDL